MKRRQMTGKRKKVYEHPTYCKLAHTLYNLYAGKYIEEPTTLAVFKFGRERSIIKRHV